MNRDFLVCAKCGRKIENTPNATRGWLIDNHRNAEKFFNGEMVIRCPQCVTDYAIRCAKHGRMAIR